MRVSAELPPDLYKALVHDAREQYRRLPDQVAFVLARALRNGETHENAAVTAAAFSEGESDAPSKVHVSG